MQLHFSSGSPDSHACESRREGDWIVFTCPQCEEFERRINFETGEQHTTPSANPYILHQGSFMPAGFEADHLGAN